MSQIMSHNLQRHAQDTYMQRNRQTYAKYQTDIETLIRRIYKQRNLDIETQETHNHFVSSNFGRFTPRER